MLYRLLDHCDSCAKLTAATEGQKQLTPEPCSLKHCSLMHVCVLEHSRTMSRTQALASPDVSGHQDLQAFSLFSPDMVIVSAPVLPKER